MFAEEFSILQVINLEYGISLLLKFTILNCGTLLLASAEDDANIHLYIDENAEHKNFIKSVVIKGHSDWVRGLDFTNDGKNFIYICIFDNEFYVLLFPKLF